ncbi:DinB family protein [Nocardioides zeae]|uniref:DinB family protein n=1 Tax=Nocardioides imazamoxiresistens TaxID=3231893 RepID=A0ABU3PZF4_9ACTN|nr:DinB family protein [Nocardioides zeae]MDT9594150.1 DinB family protein [Nocardioides zeae]
MDDPKETLRRYLHSHRETVLWKLDGLSERDQRWPATPTGTNLLGLVKHLAFTEAGYLGEVFGRPLPDPPAWMVEADGPDAEPNADMWATAEETPAEIAALYRRVAAHSEATIAALDLDARGRVPWWEEDVTLHQVLVHLLAETARHAGHADVVRESLDGGRGLADGNDNLPPVDDEWWEGYVGRLADIAERSR